MSSPMIKQYSQHLCTTELLCLTPLIMLQCLRTIIRPKSFTRIHHLPESCTFNAIWWFVPNFRKCWGTVLYIPLFNLNSATKISPPWNKCTCLLKFSLDHCEILCQYSQMFWQYLLVFVAWLNDFCMNEKILSVTTPIFKKFPLKE